MPGRFLAPLLLCSLALPAVASAQSPLSAAGPATPAVHTPPAPLPGRATEACGMTQATASYGEIAVGSVVTLQRHREVRGDDNWDARMERFIGRAAHVVRLSGIDTQGCPCVRVDVDGGAREGGGSCWRIRDLGIGTGMQPLPAEVAASEAFPQNCHQSEMAPSYGAATLGATVVLGHHRPVDGEPDWAEEMQQWVGRAAHVVQLGGLDSQGCPGVRVDIDGQQWFWRIRDLHQAGDTGAYYTPWSDQATSYTPSLGITTDHGRPATSVGTGLFGSGGTPGPQACGLTAAQIAWDPIALGASVTLGRHREVNGDEHWNPAMDQYVGLTAHVMQLSGVDEDAQGCPVVRVDVDGGYYLWRVRDLTVTAGGTAPTPGWSGIMTWPHDCGQQTASYGPIVIGTRLVLGAHTPYTGPDGQGGFAQQDSNWADEMSQYVGLPATVMALGGLDAAGCSVVQVDVDGGSFYWRIRDAQPVP